MERSKQLEIFFLLITSAEGQINVQASVQMYVVMLTLGGIVKLKTLKEDQLTEGPNRKKRGGSRCRRSVFAVLAGASQRESFGQSQSSLFDPGQPPRQTSRWLFPSRRAPSLFLHSDSLTHSIYSTYIPQAKMRDRAKRRRLNSDDTSPLPETIIDKSSWNGFCEIESEPVCVSVCVYKQKAD